jgi:hypothetical protein
MAMKINARTPEQYLLLLHERINFVGIPAMMIYMSLSTAPNR